MKVFKKAGPRAGGPMMVAMVAMVVMAMTIGGCEFMSGSARPERPSPSTEAGGGAAGVGAGTPVGAPAVELVWAKGDEVRRPERNDAGELVFLDELPGGEASVLRVGKLGGEKIASVIALHAAEDGQGASVSPEAHLESRYDRIGGHWQLLLGAFLTERGQASIPGWAHRILVTVQDDAGRRAQVTVRFRVAGAPPLLMELGETEPAPLELNRAAIEEGAIGLHERRLKNPYPARLTIWAPGNPGPVHLRQLVRYDHLMLPEGGPAAPVSENHLSAVDLEVRAELLGSDGVRREPRAPSPGRPTAWAIEPGEVVTLRWRAVPTRTCAMPVAEVQRVEWGAVERRCTRAFNIAPLCKDEPVTRSASILTRWTLAAAMIENPPSFPVHATWEGADPESAAPVGPGVSGAVIRSPVHLPPVGDFARAPTLACQGLY